MRARRGLSHTHVGSLHAPDAELALRNARDLYTRRQEGVSIWVVPAERDHRVQPGREGRLLRPGRRQGLPPPHLLRGAGRGGPPVNATFELRAAPRRRRADRRAAARRVGRPRARDGGGHRAGQHRPRPARRGPAAATYAGELEGAGRDEDALAYLRDDREFRNCLLVELPNGDFARDHGQAASSSPPTSCCSTTALAGCADERLAAIGAKARKESAYHLDHAALWVKRLGDGTAESHRRMQDAVDEVWPYTHELFAATSDPAAPSRPGHACAPTFDADGRRGAGRGDADPARRRLGARRRPGRRAHRAPVVPARRDAGAAPRPPRGARRGERPTPGRPRRAVVDPEIRVITIDELGILRAVDEDPATGRVTVTITPTYTGCPAMDVIRADIRRALAAAGHPGRRGADRLRARPGAPTGSPTRAGPSSPPPASPRPRRRRRRRCR